MTEQPRDPSQTSTRTGSWDPVPVAHRVPAILSVWPRPPVATSRNTGRVEAHVLSERPPALARSRAAALAQRITPALLLACVLIGAWLLVDPRSPDLAAQSYRETLFQRYGFTLWDSNWYAGHHLPGYSLIFPWLALALGMRVVGALAVLVSTLAFERIVVPI